MKILFVCNYKPSVGGISGQVKLLQDHLKSEGHVADIFSTKGRILWRLGLLRRLRRVACDYDVLHVHCCSGWGFLPAVVGVSVGRRLQKRVVLTYHGGGGEHFFDRHSHLVRHYLSRTDRNIVLSGFLAAVFDKHGLPCVIIPNIIEQDESHYRQRGHLQPHFICTRAHEPLYNIPCIIRAFTGLKQRCPEATLTLVGAGSQHEELKRMASAINGVTFIGRVSNEEIHRYLDRADVLLSTPHIDNMPVSLLEAMDSGMLVISTAVGGVPYMLGDGVEALLVPDDDSQALADRMLWAVEHQDESLTIIEQAHKALTAYRWASVRPKLYETYGLSE